MSKKSLASAAALPSPRPAMPRWLTTATASLILLAGLSAAVPAQTADKILGQALKAMGGEKAIKRVTSRQATGTITRPADGATGRYQSAAMAPNFYALSIEIGGLEASLGYNGKSAWSRDSRNGLRTLTGQESNDFQAEAVYRNRRWFDYKKDKAKLAAEGQKTVNDKPANVVVLTTAKNVKIRMYFDAASGMLVREEIPRGAVTKTFDYGDYRVVDGVKEPFTVNYTEGEERFTVRLDAVTHNRRVESARFDFPKVSGEPLPDIPALLEQVKENQENLVRLRDKYTFTQTTIEREFDDKGVMKNKESYTHDVSFYHGYRLYKLIEKNGKPLTPDEEKKALSDLEKAVKRIEKREADKAKKEQKKQEAAAKGKDEDEGDDENEGRNTIADMLHCSKLLNPRRERFRNRDVIVFDFEPNPEYKPKTNFEKFAQRLKLIGAFWIDPIDKQVARLELRLSDTFKIAGGMFVSLKPGSGMVFEQERINNEVWMPSYQEVNFAARVFLIKGFTGNSVTRFSDYKIFNVNAEKEKLKDPVKPE
ncbi:MAG TPA: hypothetical protein VFD58_33905 [Blastocatellia bacterium]|nr:hypothetical protein [Blastocatellia bacterium]